VAAARERGIHAGFTLVEPDRAGMLAIAELVEAGKLRVEIAEGLPLSEARRARELGETERTPGKLVLRVRD
jgi:NADPH:quinone reductase-like Zn-dependent oxidoreductase